MLWRDLEQLETSYSRGSCDARELKVQAKGIQGVSQSGVECWLPPVTCQLAVSEQKQWRGVLIDNVTTWRYTALKSHTGHKGLDMSNIGQLEIRLE